jgi:predicted ATPase with chaperone activity
LTSKGVERAVEALGLSGYVGPAPVPLQAYIDQVRKQSVHKADIHREDIEKSLSHLVLRGETRDLIGQAITAKKATLIYGASGNGKTSAAVGLEHALGGEILIPYAVEVMREIIQVYDPSTHRVIEVTDADSAVGRPQHDRRWLVIKRPAAFAAGELAATHLELMLDEVHKTYEAPIQLKANGGFLIIDDFGRQRLDAAYLLNRWVTPLERGIDHLSLHSGARFEVPFDAIPVFASNRPPAELADEAFLRRIRYKIEIPSPDVPLFLEILRRDCARYEVAYEESAATYLVEEHFRKNGREVRGCHPRDLVEMVADAARYQGQPRALTRSTIDKACEQYFT